MLYVSARSALPLLLLSSCRSAALDINDMPMKPEITLECRFSRPSADLVEIRYTLSNAAPHPIYAFTPLSDYQNSQYAPAPARVYVQLAPNGLVTLSRRLWETPETVSVFMPEVPFLTRVAAGGSLEETVRIPIPLIVNYPYLGAGAPEQDQRPVHRDAATAVFTMGYIPEEDGLTVTEAPGSPGLFAIGYGPGITRQKLVSCKAVPLKASVIVR